MVASVHVFERPSVQSPGSAVFQLFLAFFILVIVAAYTANLAAFSPPHSLVTWRILTRAP